MIIYFNITSIKYKYNGQSLKLLKHMNFSDLNLFKNKKTFIK